MNKTAVVFLANLTVPLLAAQSIAQKPAPDANGSATMQIRRAADGHPDLSGLWSVATALPFGGLRRTVNGEATTASFDNSGRNRIRATVKGALPWTAAPEYKPE